MPIDQLDDLLKTWGSKDPTTGARRHLADLIREADAAAAATRVNEAYVLILYVFGISTNHVLSKSADTASHVSIDPRHSNVAMTDNHYASGTEPTQIRRYIQTHQKCTLPLVGTPVRRC